MGRTQWLTSCTKHGISREDAIHAVRESLIEVIDFDSGRIPGKARVDLHIGPSRDGATMIEVLMHVDGRAEVVEVFHVMELRRSTLDRARRTIGSRAGGQP